MFLYELFPLQTGKMVTGLAREIEMTMNLSIIFSYFVDI